jgi:hypothetical protein
MVWGGREWGEGPENILCRPFRLAQGLKLGGCRASRDLRAVRRHHGHFDAQGKVRLQRAIGTAVIVAGVMALRVG